MNRRVLKPGLLLLLGAVINVAVASGCALWCSEQWVTHPGWLKRQEIAALSPSIIAKIPRDWLADPRDQTLPSLSEEKRGVMTPEEWGEWMAQPRPDNSVLLVEQAEANGFGVRSITITSTVHLWGSIDGPPERVLFIHRAGWPFLSLEFHELQSHSSFEARSQTIPWQGGLAAADVLRAKTADPPMGSRWPRPLPLRPLWPGFAINSIFYAAIFWLPFAALGASRRKRRIKRGLCPACAYPVGESDLCTECGRRHP